MSMLSPSLVKTKQGKPLQKLYFTQFLSAFADNMILFITLAIIHQRAYPDFYIGVVQGAFLLAYVVLAPFVGSFADKNAKSQVLLAGNALKAAGIVALLAGLNPAWSYAIVGVGAAVYSPAKYGILPELTNGDSELLKANARLEGYTIFAILTGSVCGGFMAKLSITTATVVCLAIYLVSLLMTLSIPKLPGNPAIRYSKDIRLFFRDLVTLFADPKTRFSLLGTGSFWMTSSVVRLAVIAWVPLHIGIESVDQISMLVAVTGVGIMLGAILTPYFIPLKRFFNAYRFGLLMVFVLLLVPFVYNLYLTIALLLLIGFCGGVFIVPMNAVLQDEGHRKVGAGKTIAVQNLMDNGLMLIGVGGYTQITKLGVSPDSSLVGIAVILLLFVGYLIVERRRFTYIS